MSPEPTLRGFLETHWERTLKQPQAALKFPFVDPGSVYGGNLWDWDSFWAVYGLFSLLDGNPELKRRGTELVLDHARGNVRNFFALQLEDGYIPMMVEVSDGAAPYLLEQHRQGKVLNMHKPFLCQQINLISGWSGEDSWASGFRDGLERYFACYDRYYLHAATGLYVWADDVMIGMDNDPATFGRPRFSTANIFLNSFLVAELRAMARYCRVHGDAQGAARYRAKADALVEAVQAECWDSRDRFFYSVDVDVQTRAYDWFHKGLGVFWKSLPIKIRAWSGFLPLWAGITAPTQTEALVRHLTDPATFWAPCGVTSLAMDEKMYNLDATNNPSNWLGPIWVVVQFIAFRALIRAGRRDLAQEVARRTSALLGRDIAQTGTLHEYYHPQTGEPVMNGGFINWNLLALTMEAELRGTPTLDRFLWDQ